MFPDLSGAARLALRALPIDPRFVVEQSVVFRELLDKGLAVRQPRAGIVLTILGARELLAIMVEEELATPCACGAPLSEHNGTGTRDLPERKCRAFTPAKPVYVKPNGGQR